MSTCPRPHWSGAFYARVLYSVMRLAFYTTLAVFLFALMVRVPETPQRVLEKTSDSKVATSTSVVPTKTVQKVKEITKPKPIETKPKAAPVATTTATTRTSELIKLPSTFTATTLARYDGTDPTLPIFIAFEGNVYDVSAGRSYYEKGGAYHFLAGTDGTTLLQAIGGDIIKRKYSIVATFTQ